MKKRFTIDINNVTPDEESMIREMVESIDARMEVSEASDTRVIIDFQRQLDPMALQTLTNHIITFGRSVDVEWRMQLPHYDVSTCPRSPSGVHTIDAEAAIQQPHPIRICTACGEVL